MEQKKVLAVASLLSVLVLLVGCETMNWPKMTLNTQDFPPFSYETDEVVYGPARHIIEKVCTEAKIKCSFKLLDWGTAQDEVRDGTVEGMFVIGWNAERDRWLYFSPPLLETEYGFFVREDSPLEYKDESDVKGYTVGVYGPSNTAKSLERVRAQIKDMTIDMQDDDIPVFQDLSNGKLDAAYSNRDVGNTIIAQLGLQNVRYAGAHRKLKYYVGFSKRHNDEEVVNRFNATYRALHERGEIQRILTNYQMNSVKELD